MSFINNLRNAARIAEQNPYFASYIQNATNDVSNITSVSNIPTNVPLETLVALSTFRPIVVPNTVVQSGVQNIERIQNATRAKLQVSGVNITNLSNFTPSIAGNAIQTKGRPTINDRRINGIVRATNARQRFLAGLDPKTRKLVQDLEDLKKLRELQLKLEAIVAKVEQDIIKYTGIFNAIVNAPDAIASAFLTSLINKIDLLERTYTATKNLILAVAKAIENTRRAIQKALYTDIPTSVARIRTGVDAVKKLLKLPEISLRIKFPKRPKLPRINFTFGDFYSKFKKQLEILKKKNGEFYQKAYDTAIQQSGIEIIDPKKDKLQQGLTKARNALKEARAQLQARQAIRNEAINRARTQLVNNIRKTTQTTERERQRIVNESASVQRNAKNALARAQAKLQDIASRRMYLTPEEQRMIVPSNRVNVERINVLDDLPLSRPVIVAGSTVQGIIPGTTLQTGFTTPDGRTVFKDRRTEKLYVLQSPQERVAELTATSVNRFNANVQEVSATIGTINTAIATAAEVQATLNNKVLKAEFGVNLVQQAQTVNSITQQARIDINTTNEQNTDQENLNAQANANIVFESDTFSINAETKTVTTTTRRLSSSQAANQATGYNRTIAEKYGYTTPLTIRPSGPKNINVNGQSVYEIILAIVYKDFNPLNSARLAQLGEAPSTLVSPQISPSSPITELPISVV